MTVENEQVMKEYLRYGDFCSRFTDNLAEGSAIVDRLKKINADIIIDQHLAGYMKIRLLQLAHKNHRQIPFGDIPEENKTRAYSNLENEYRVSLIEFNEIKGQYTAFYMNSAINDFFAKPEEIIGATIDNSGNFSYPIINQRLIYMIRYLKTQNVENLIEATELADRKMSKYQSKNQPVKLLYPEGNSVAKINIRVGYQLTKNVLHSI